MTNALALQRNKKWARIFECKFSEFCQYIVYTIPRYLSFYLLICLVVCLFVCLILTITTFFWWQ